MKALNIFIFCGSIHSKWAKWERCLTHGIGEQLYEVPCSGAHSVLEVEPLLAKEEEVLHVDSAQFLSWVHTTAHWHLAIVEKSPDIKY